MEIHQIKARLTIHEVLGHYGLRPNKNGMLRCPFHEDKEPSLKVYPGIPYPSQQPPAEKAFKAGSPPGLVAASLHAAGPPRAFKAEAKAK
jgi:hypothetical protein